MVKNKEYRKFESFSLQLMLRKLAFTCHDRVGHLNSLVVCRPLVVWRVKNEALPYSDQLHVAPEVCIDFIRLF